MSSRGDSFTYGGNWKKSVFCHTWCLVSPKETARGVLTSCPAPLLHRHLFDIADPRAWPSLVHLLFPSMNNSNWTNREYAAGGRELCYQLYHLILVDTKDGKLDSALVTVRTVGQGVNGFRVHVSQYGSGICSTRRFCKWFQGPWILRLLACLAVVPDSSHCTPGLAAWTLFRLWLG